MSNQSSCLLFIKTFNSDVVVDRAVGPMAATFVPPHSVTSSPTPLAASTRQAQGYVECSPLKTEQESDMYVQTNSGSSAYYGSAGDNTCTGEDDVEWVEGFEALGPAKSLDHSGDSDSGEETDLHWQLPENHEDIDIDVLAALPTHLRKDLIEEARRKDRAKQRSNYLPVAGDPSLYSQTQLANFLKGRWVDGCSLLHDISALYFYTYFAFSPSLSYCMNTQCG